MLRPPPPPPHPPVCFLLYSICLLLASLCPSALPLRPPLPPIAGRTKASRPGHCRPLMASPPPPLAEGDDAYSRYIFLINTVLICGTLPNHCTLFIFYFLFSIFYFLFSIFQFFFPIFFSYGSFCEYVIR